MRKTATKAEIEAAAEYREKQLRKDLDGVREQYYTERTKCEAAERKLHLYEKLDQVIECYAKQMVAKDEPAVQLGLFEVPTGKLDGYKDPITRPVCKTVDEAIEQIFEDLDSAVDDFNVYLEDEVAMLEDERQQFLRALGMDEYEWARVSWKY